ncbi:hypothetical protein P8452_08904 [Trifolium repens]|nr:hypothetical protein P8452_08904 [Trifolium repens]
MVPTASSSSVALFLGGGGWLVVFDDGWFVANVTLHPLQWLSVAHMVALASMGIKVSGLVEEGDCSSYFGRLQVSAGYHDLKLKFIGKRKTAL